MIYTDGRKFNVMRPTAIDGLVRQNTLDYVLGLDFSLPAETRLNLQFFQRVFFAHDPDPFYRQGGARGQHTTQRQSLAQCRKRRHC